MEQTPDLHSRLEAAEQDVETKEPQFLEVMLIISEGRYTIDALRIGLDWQVVPYFKARGARDILRTVIRHRYNKEELVALFRDLERHAAILAKRCTLVVDLWKRQLPSNASIVSSIHSEFRKLYLTIGASEAVKPML